MQDEWEYNYSTFLCSYKFFVETKKWRKSLAYNKAQFDSFTTQATKILILDDNQFNFKYYKQDDTWEWQGDLSGIFEEPDKDDPSRLREPIRCTATRTMPRSTPEDFHMFTGRTYKWGWYVQKWYDSAVPFAPKGTFGLKTRRSQKFTIP